MDMSKIVSCKDYVAIQKKELKDKVSTFERNPKLCVVQIGNDKASNVYVRNKQKVCEEIGIEFNHVHIEDYEKVAEIVSKKGKEKAMTILVGHGTYDPSTAQYAMLDHVMQTSGHKDFVVGTVEGYPSFNNAIDRIQEQKKIKEVQLLPFMFVAGDHAKNDIAGDMKQELVEKGYKVTVLLEGLGQNPEIQDIFIDHIRFMTKHRMIDIMDKKKAYTEEESK